jgi:hypothetical protein
MKQLQVAVFAWELPGFFYGKVHISFNVLCSQLSGDSLQITPMQEVVHIQNTISCIKNFHLKEKIM